ncbi:MAG: anti-sigma F factor [Clostridia bacterium]|nr:MAG: anti-sigma F factor [Clostridia bacterium]
MATIVNSMKLEFPSRAENLGMARVAVAAFASQLEFTLEELEEIKVAVSEAVTNAIVHGYDNRAGLVWIVASRSQEHLEIVIRDEGKGMADVERILAVGLEGVEPGLGFMFMKSFMDEVRVDSEPGKGTAVIMIKRARSLAQAAATQI